MFLDKCLVVFYEFLYSYRLVSIDATERIERPILRDDMSSLEKHFDASTNVFRIERLHVLKRSVCPSMDMTVNQVPTMIKLLPLCYRIMVKVDVYQ